MSQQWGAYSHVSLQVTSAVPQNLVAKEDKRLMTWTQATMTVVDVRFLK